MFNRIVEFTQGLTKEMVVGNTARVTNEEAVEVVEVPVVDEYKNSLLKMVEERMEEIDNEFNYRLKRLSLSMEDEVQLTPFVKGGRL